MAEIKISDLTENTTPLVTDVIPIVSGGVTKKVQLEKALSLAIAQGEGTSETKAMSQKTATDKFAQVESDLYFPFKTDSNRNDTSIKISTGIKELYLLSKVDNFQKVLLIAKNRTASEYPFQLYIGSGTSSANLVFSASYTGIAKKEGKEFIKLTSNGFESGTIKGYAIINWDVFEDGELFGSLYSDDYLLSDRVYNIDNSTQIKAYIYELNTKSSIVDLNSDIIEVNQELLDNMLSIEQKLSNNTLEIESVKNVLPTSFSTQTVLLNMSLGGYNLSGVEAPSLNRMRTEKITLVNTNKQTTLNCSSSYEYIVFYATDSTFTELIVFGDWSTGQHALDLPTLYFIVIARLISDADLSNSDLTNVSLTYTDLSEDTLIECASKESVDNLNDSILNIDNVSSENKSNIEILSEKYNDFFGDLDVSWTVGSLNYLTGAIVSTGDRLVSSPINVEFINAVSTSGLIGIFINGYSGEPSTNTFVASTGPTGVLFIDVNNFVTNNPTVTQIVILIFTNDGNLLESKNVNYNLKNKSGLEKVEDEITLKASELARLSECGIRSVVTIKKDGTGDYTSLSQALQGIEDKVSDINPYEIQLFDNFEALNVNDYTSYVTIHAIGRVRKNIKITGIGSKKILYSELPTSGFTQSERASYQTLYIDPGCELENLNIVANRNRYPIHFETSGSNLMKDRMTRLINCRIEHKGGEDVDAVENKWYQPDGFGCGTSSGNLFEFIGCEFLSMTDAFRMHTNTTFENAVGAKFVGCKFIQTADKMYQYRNGSYSYYNSVAILLDNLGSNQTRKYEFINCAIGGALYQNSSWYNNTEVNKVQPLPQIKGGGNSPFYYKTISSGGTSIKIESLISGVDSSVKLIQDDANLFGNTTIKKGSLGLKSYIFGDNELGDNLGINTLNVRLGNCLSTNKLLILEIDGVERVVTFNEDFLSQTVSQCIGFINNSLSSWATVTPYYWQSKYYPELTDVLYLRKNIDSTPILKGEFCIFSEFNKLKHAPENYVGNNLLMAIEDIAIEEFGRVIKNCHIKNDGIFNPLFHSTVSTWVEGDMFRITLDSKLEKCTEENLSYGVIEALSNDLLYLK